MSQTAMPEPTTGFRSESVVQRPEDDGRRQEYTNHSGNTALGHNLSWAALRNMHRGANSVISRIDALITAERKLEPLRAHLARHE